MIPYGKQWIDEEDIQAVVDVLRSDYVTTGPAVTRFEQAICDYTGAKYAVAIANGTAALHAACFAAGIGEGDEVITTPITFAASANCVLYCGGIPVFADVDPRTYNIDPKDIERKITDKTKAIIPVHFAGQPCDMDAIYEIAKRHRLLVIEDGAHAIGASYKGKKIGGLSDMTTFSFHPVKPVTTGEGGAIVTNDKALYELLILFRSHGITRDSKRLTKQEGGWYYEQQFLGYNYRMTDIQAALGESQLKKLDSFVARRKELAKRYQEAFESIQGIVTPYVMPECESGWHIYVIQVTNQNRSTVFQKLRDLGVGVNVHYIPVYQHPYYREHGYADVRCENAEQVYNGFITLPLYPRMTDAEQDTVIKAVLECIG